MYQVQPSLQAHTTWTPSLESPVQVQVQLLVSMTPDPHCSPSQVLVGVLPQYTNTKVKKVAIFQLYKTNYLIQVVYFQVHCSDITVVLFTIFSQ
jgi:hypothetical protein